MTTSWYIARNKQRIGPFSTGQLHQLAVLGLVQPTEYVLPEGSTRWVPATTVEGLLPAAAASQSRDSRAHLGLGSSHLDMSGEEARLHLAGKAGDPVARLISTLLDMQRRYADNPSMVDLIEQNIQALKTIRERRA